jgi:hypothetical protein
VDESIPLRVLLELESVVVSYVLHVEWNILAAQAAPPLGPPTSLRAIATTHSSCTLQWDPPQVVFGSKIDVYELSMMSLAGCHLSLGYFPRSFLVFPLVFMSRISPSVPVSSFL